MMAPVGVPKVDGPVIRLAIEEVRREYYGELNDWERGFIDSLSSWPECTGFTERQMRCVVRILQRVGERV